MTEEKDSKLESQEEQPKFNQEQYDRLIECSKKGPEGIKVWNEWREKNQSERIWLQGAKLRKANLQGVDLLEANLQGAKLAQAKLQEAYLENAKLQGAYFRNTHMERAFLEEAKLQGADLGKAHLQGAYLMDANLRGARLVFAKLQGADLVTTNMEGADFREAKLQGADLREAKLQGAKFTGAIVNGSTNFLDCEIDENTDFRNTGLENTRIESGKKILLKYNIRRMNWKDWYKEHRLLQILVRPFWWMSDYGKSTGRIMLTFFVLAIAFAFVYLRWPCCVMVNDVVGDIRGFVHALYFSVVTMTTLGFGDIAANPDSWLGQVVLMVQVILGYVLLGAMVTRLAVLFTSDGPASSFTPMDKETKELLAKLKEDKEKSK